MIERCPFCERYMARWTHRRYFIGECYSTRGPFIIGRCDRKNERFCKRFEWCIQWHVSLPVMRPHGPVWCGQQSLKRRDGRGP